LFSVKKEKTDLTMIMPIMYKADIDAYKDLVAFMMARIGESKLKMFKKQSTYPMELNLVEEDTEESEESMYFLRQRCLKSFYCYQQWCFAFVHAVCWELYLVALLKRR